MSHKFLQNTSFHLLLNKLDHELAEEVKKRCCPSCGNPLHQADYPRSPMGVPESFREYYEERLSFCCNRDTCRKRTTPPSVRFFGRRWFPAPHFLLLCVLTHGINERRLADVKRHFGMRVSESTWKRWRRWWREAFIETLFWKGSRGIVVTHLKANKPFPRALLVLFKGVLKEKLMALLQFLSPLTGGVLRAV